VRREGGWQQGGHRWVLEECPWNGHGDNSAYIVRFSGGAIAAGCHHDSCQGYGWRDLRKLYEPDAYTGHFERNGYERNGHADDVSPTGILLSEVIPERVRWLWDGRIALGKLNLVDGDPGTGKSAATTDLAARVSVGKPWPDGAGCEAGGVVILSAEDGLADTIRPRFDAAGGDPSMAVAVSTVPDAEGNERQIAIPDDLHVIEAAIERVGGVLVIVDPLMAFLPGEVNSHRDQDVRRALAPLARLAERTGAAVVVVRHLNKGTGGNTLYWGGGSIGILGAAQSGLLIAKHPEDDNRRVLASIKSNLAAPAPSLVFGLESTESRAVVVEWKGESDLDASALLAAPTDHEERSTAQAAQDFLRDMLFDGPRAVKDIRAQANEAGLSWRTVERAKATLGVRATREGEAGKRGGGAWVWALPSIKPATLSGWRRKPSVDRSDAANMAYPSQDEQMQLRPPTADGVKSVDGAGGLNRPLSADLAPGQSATLSELATRREAKAAGAEMRRSKSGPALALKTYLEKPNEQRLEWLTKAVLTVRGVDTANWRDIAAAVKAAEATGGALSAVSERDTLGFFAHCGYAIPRDHSL
jgi:RecA-family ATPase